jgi:hypothetical protein
MEGFSIEIIVDLHVMCRCEMLQVSVKGSCLHRPENWLVRQLIDS